ncbi:ATP-binding protein [Paenibacillus paeoniae]|uniref:ATP-binding protein n=1 Tax=Paenibacillus paeoniae TaxID=2292705 RepID=UPI001F0C457E|nr:ATP-binding protein [Paenibacillus paeoniae]
MSIKAKLSVSISAIVAAILALNIMFSYISTKVAQEAALEQQIQSIVEQLGVTLEVIETTREAMDAELGQKLRMAAIVVKEKLHPNIKFVSNEQLVSLSKELNLDDITLWQRIDGEVVSVLSSNPEEINLSSKTWDYWDRAFHQLFDLKDVSVGKGDALQHYWSGPINYAVSDPTQINKWGYFFDGTTNYMINTIINTDENFSFDLVGGTTDVIAKLKTQQPSLLEVTGFDPQFFGTKPIIKMKKGIPVYNLDVRDIPFGQYEYRNTQDDTLFIQTVLKDGGMQTGKYTINGKEVLRSFIPLKINADKTYVIGVAFDKAELKEPIHRQLLAHVLISLCLLMFAMLASYFIAGYMLRSLNQIIHKVNAIADGKFDVSISIQNKDELGLLASRVNSMGVRLLNYTTQLKETARELQSTKQYLESFVNHTSDAIHVVDLDGHIIQVNHAFEAIYGWSSEEVTGQLLPNLPNSQFESHEILIATIMEGGSVTDFETVRYTKDGGLIDVSITISAIRDELDEIMAIATISRNITSRKQSEEMIRRSDKLAVVGQLAAGVAHEVRNPLTTLRGFVQLQKQTGSLSMSHLDLMLSELDQINMIVSEFLVLAKPQAIRHDYLNVGDLLKDIVMLMDSEARMNKVNLTIHQITDIPVISGVGSQLKQVFVNMIKNGVEAMPDGGELTIELSAAEDSHEMVIRFTDQGLGITEEDMARLGEPFFTRKEGGNGLGVMICQQIIRNHNGKLSYRSLVGEGTCVEIRLPMNKAAEI